MHPYPECSLPPSSRHCPLRSACSGLSIAVAWKENRLHSMIRGSKGKIAGNEEGTSRRIELLQVQVTLDCCAPESKALLGNDNGRLKARYVHRHRTRGAEIAPTLAPWVWRPTPRLTPGVSARHL